MQESFHNAQRRVGFLGKIPGQPDFVRQPIADPIGREFDQWLMKSAQNLQLAKVDLPDGCVRFVFSAPAVEALAVGVMAKSRDQVGRAFPLAIYAAFPLAPAVAAFHALPLAHSAFLAQAEAVVTSAASLPLENLRGAVDRLEEVPTATLAIAAERCAEVLRSSPSAEFFARLFPPEPPGGHLYGLHTLCTAAAAVRGAPASAPPTVLGCPIATDVDLLAWLELARRCLDWPRNVPSFAWVEEPEPRLMLALGHASDQLLHFVADPKHGSARLWPLTTDRAEAVQRARAALGLPLEPPAQLDALFQLLARGSR